MTRSNKDGCIIHFLFPSTKHKDITVSSFAYAETTPTKRFTLRMRNSLREQDGAGRDWWEKRGNPGRGKHLKTMLWCLGEGEGGVRDFCLLQCAMSCVSTSTTVAAFSLIALRGCVAVTVAADVDVDVAPSSCSSAISTRQITDTHRHTHPLVVVVVPWFN